MNIPISCGQPQMSYPSLWLQFGVIVRDQLTWAKPEQPDFFLNLGQSIKIDLAHSARFINDLGGYYSLPTITLTPFTQKNRKQLILSRRENSSKSGDEHIIIIYRRVSMVAVLLVREGRRFFSIANFFTFSQFFALTAQITHYSKMQWTPNRAVYFPSKRIPRVAIIIFFY